jgi:phage terminase large subunit-like protein
VPKGTERLRITPTPLHSDGHIAAMTHALIECWQAIPAEPVSVLYAQGRVHHVGALPDLEDELCDFGPGGLTTGRSPDRMDALVWALTELMLRDRR